MDYLIHTAEEGVNSTIIQCVHEQSLTGICIFPVFYLLPSNGSHMYKLLIKTKKKCPEFEAHESLKRVASTNAILNTIKVLL